MPSHGRRMGVPSCIGREIVDVTHTDRLAFYVMPSSGSAETAVDCYEMGSFHGRGRLTEA